MTGVQTCALPISYTRKEKVWEDGREVEREIEFFGWEKLDAVDLIKQEFGL